MKNLSLIILSMMFLWTGTAAAADWNFYGSARVSTFYNDVETASGTTKNFNTALQSNSRIGARVKVSDTLAGRFEYGASGGNANIRHLYGEWTFGSGSFLVGQTDTPLNFSLSNQVIGSDNNLDPYGHVDGKRKAMLRLSFGDFMIAAIENGTSNLNLGSPTTETKIPKLEAKYRFGLPSGFVELAGGYQSYELINAGSEYDVKSYILALGGQIQAGAAYLNGAAWGGQNPGPYGYNLSPDGNPTVSAGQLIDNEAYGYMLAAGYKLSEMFSFEIGYGYVKAELDQSSSQKDDAASYYIQSTITMAPGVFIVPEIGRIDEKTNASGVRENDTVYAGAKWQINF